MDQSLEHIDQKLIPFQYYCFNPYFSGSVTGTCFRSEGKSGIYVSILILVDQSLEQGMVV